MQDFSGALVDLGRRLDEARGYLRIEELTARLPQLEVELGRPDLWDDPDAAQKVQREFASLSDDLQTHTSLEGALDDVSTLAELAREEGDESLEPEIADAISALAARFDDLELRALFTGEWDDCDAIMEFNSGAGGVDAQDWCEMLMRMYLRWADRHGFDVEIDAASPGTEAGISSATFVVKGRYVYGRLRSEHGVHRLVRISPFDNAARRQTSFTSVKITPFIEDERGEIEIDDKDLRVDVYRSSGAGGQHVNVTDSAVRLTHLPTGIVVSCQNERSQHQNKDQAMKVLKAKLLDLQRQEHEAKLAAITGDQLDANFGSQIRSYVQHPYQMVKDLRTNEEVGNVDAVLDGDLDRLMEGFLRHQRAHIE
ncbi:MAG: peptide chain release factor 2 [Microthrixaceae bacterium]